MRVAAQKELVIMKKQLDGLLFRCALRQLGAVQDRRGAIEPWK